jgi:hypothetical protein
MFKIIFKINLINNLASELLGKQRKRFTPKRTELK